MARYGLVWGEVPEQQYRSLPERLQRRIDAVTEWLAERPTLQCSYDPASDLWTLPVDGTALLVYAVVHAHMKIIILRLVVMS